MQTNIISIKSSPIQIDDFRNANTAKESEQQKHLIDTDGVARKFPIFGPIDGDVAQSFIQSMIIWMNESISEPVEVWINSPGGSAPDALAIYDIIKYAPFPIHTIGIGEVCSAAVLLLSAGDKGYRALFPNCRLMLHSLSYGAEGTLQDMHVIFEEVKNLQTTWARLTSENTNMTPDEVLEMFASNKDQWLSADKAIKLGIVDKLIKL